MAENKTVTEAQEALKTEKTYKVTCGTYKKRKEALQAAAEARRVGVNVSLVIKKAVYSLLYAENITKAEAEAVKKAIEAKKIKTEIFEQ